ncbi:hypothetical protein GDO78_018393 [Eleutherodactylus coqui]|uniref:Uncharacterized protein n=1 Tax=Eleutherodactylus coqui TaxID=57060 RepID=A0A8J6B5F1_ELECQ|nr:hypothetical protein GDO78_018393 [Eleutherodactylus coqui]
MDMTEKLRDSVDICNTIYYSVSHQDYTAVKKTSSERWQNFVSEGHGRTLSPITGPSTHYPIHEDFNGQKILEHVLKMTELLTGEVTLRGMGDIIQQW